MNVLSIRVWQGLAEWRCQLHRTLTQIDIYYLKLLRADLQHLLEDVEHEIAMRPQ